MELRIYVDAVMQKLKDANYYTELKEYELRPIVEQYLRSEYNDRVALLNLEIDMTNARGEALDPEFYRSKLTDITSYIITLTRELGRVSLD